MASEPSEDARPTRILKRRKRVGPKTASLKSERVDIASKMQAVKQVEQWDTLSFSMKPEGIDIASHMESGKQPEPDLSLVAAKLATSIEGILSAITSVEGALQEKRRQIEAIKNRQEDLAREYCQLGTSLDAASCDLAHQFNRVASHLDGNVVVSNPRANVTKD